MHLGALEQRAYGDGELLLAGQAIVQAGTVRLALYRACLLSLATVRAVPPVRPAQRLKVRAGLVFVMKNGI